MNELTEDERRQIEQVHSSWIEFELTGANHNLMTFADDIELWESDKQINSLCVDVRKLQRSWQSHQKEFTAL